MFITDGEVQAWAERQLRSLRINPNTNKIEAIKAIRADAHDMFDLKQSKDLVETILDRFESATPTATTAAWSRAFRASRELVDSLEAVEDGTSNHLQRAKSLLHDVQWTSAQVHRAESIGRSTS